MENKIAASKQWFILLTLAVSLSGSLLVPLQARAQSEPASPQAPPPATKVTSFMDPKTDTLVEVSMGGSSTEQIRSYSPKRFTNFLLSSDMCKPGLLVSTNHFLFHEYPGEWLRFHTAVLGTMLPKFKNDPDALRHFIDNNGASGIGHGTFMVFMLTGKLVQKAAQAMDLAYNPCNPTHIANGYFNPKNMPLIMKMSRHYLGPLVLAFGTVTSGISGDFARDKDVQACIAGMTKQMNERERTAFNEACEVAYENWAVSRKINQYTPEVLASMGTAAAIGTTKWAGQDLLIKDLIMKRGLPKLMQSQIVKRGAQKVLPIVFRNVMVGRFLNVASSASAMFAGFAAGPGGVMLGWAIQIGGSYVFLETLEQVMRPVFKPVEDRFHANDLTKQVSELAASLELTKKNNWQWTPLRPKYCDYQATDFDRVTGYVVPEECTTPIAKPSVLMRRLAARQKEWRQLILKEAMEAQSNWTDALGQVLDTYTAAYQTYFAVTKAINSQLYPKDAKDAGKLNWFFQPTPANGVSLTTVDKILTALQVDASKKQRFQYTINTALGTARKELADREALARSNSPKLLAEIAALREIVAGLEAVDLAKPSPDAELAVEYMLGERDRTQQRDVNRIKWEAREKKFADAMKLLNRLAPGPVLALTKERERLAMLGQLKQDDLNPFAKIKVALGDPEPQAAGMGFLEFLENNQNIINLGFRYLHPATYNRALTPKATDYLLAAMICGPGPSKDILTKTETAQKVAANLVNYVRGILGLAPGLDELAKDELIHKVKYWSITFHPPRIINDVGVDFCSQPPPSQKKANLWFDIHDSKWTIKGVEHNGFIDVIKKQVRSDIIGPSRQGYGFTDWWRDNVDVHMKPMLLEYRAHYEEIVKEKFVPALTRNHSIWANGREFALGAGRSLLNDTQDYLTIAKMVMIGSNTLTEAEHNVTMQMLARFEQRAKLAVAAFGSIDDLQWVRTQLQYADMQTTADGRSNSYATAANSLEPLTEANKHQIMADVSERLSVELRQSLGILASFAELRLQNAIQKDIAKGALLNLKEIVTEIDSYYALINTVALPMGE